MQHVDDATWATPVAGRNLSGATFGEQITRPALVCFLRHLGCVFCREMVRDVRRAAETCDPFPPVLLVHQGDVAAGDEFFARFWPGAAAISDPGRALYRAFDIGRASIGQGFGPMVWTCALRAVAKGNTIGKMAGDPWLMPGAFLIAPDRRVGWQHTFRHVADHPDWTSLPLAMRSDSSPAGAG
ncbi:MAG TPA: SelL-related redox protein [Tepidisphaeraceae bacterium]|jgi:hypothetical protein